MATIENCTFTKRPAVTIVFNEFEGKAASNLEDVQALLPAIIEAHPTPKIQGEVMPVNAKTETGLDTLENHLWDVERKVKKHYPQRYESIWASPHGSAFREPWVTTAERIKGILDNYTKHNSKGLRFLSGHWNRHHCDEVNKIAKTIHPETSVAWILEQLKAINLKNPEGSLSRRIDFIETMIEEGGHTNSNSVR